LKQWIGLNQQTLLAYWEGEMDTLDALQALVKI
jgi:hypothetical protein